ncbi:MAPK regulated corepressor interacting protein 2-like [Haliotis asinina]|uniref:MAPK regulated corepressor interacting protein 2-like n=2 Tax=Haliotis TaxID=6452 RepID=UPI0035326DCB
MKMFQSFASSYENSRREIASTAQNDAQTTGRRQGMYALSRGPSKIVASTRRGPPKQLDSLESRDISSKRAPGEPVMSSPKPVFNVNGKRAHVNRSNSAPQEPISQQHEDIVKYLNDAWNKVRHELEVGKKSERENAPLWYKERNPNPRLQGFKAFDLEEFWGKRTLEKLDLTESS